MTVGQPYPQIIQETKERQAATPVPLSLFCVLQGADFTAPGVVFVASQMKGRRSSRYPRLGIPGVHILVSGFFALPPRDQKAFPI